MDNHDYRPRNRETQQRTTSSQRPSRSSNRSTYYQTSSPRSASGRTGRSQDVYVGKGGSVFDSLMGMLPDNVWVKRGVIAAVLLIAIIILFNLVTCIGGAFAGHSNDSGQSSPATVVVSSESASAASASAAATKGVESPWIENGLFSTGDSELDAYIKQLCDEKSSKDDTYEANAFAVNATLTEASYVERRNNQSPWGTTWDIEYAKQYFEEGRSGNCYNFAAVTEYILKYFGYSDAEAEPCIVKLESGAWGDHGLVFVTNRVDGKRCIVDDALGRNGWMLDIDAYDYDVRNIAQNSTIKGNVNALDDDDNPTPIPPGELTEPETSGSAASANADGHGNANVTEQDDDDDYDVDDESDEEEDYVYDDGEEDVYDDEEGDGYYEQDYDEEGVDYYEYDDGNGGEESYDYEEQ